MEIKFATDPDCIRKCWKVIHELRPHLEEGTFEQTIQRLQLAGYQLIYIEKNGEALAAAGFETGEKLHRGKYIYIDDLSTLPAYRNQGLGSLLLDYIFDFGRKNDFDQVHLDSGVQRFDAHRLYLKKGFDITSHHFALKLK